MNEQTVALKQLIKKVLNQKYMKSSMWQYLNYS